MAKPRRKPQTHVVQDRPSASRRPRPVVVPVDVGYPEDWRHRLREVSDRIKRDRLLERQLVAQAIAAGATWSAIGDVLGVKRQTAHERFRHVAPVVRVPS